MNEQRRVETVEEFKLRIAAIIGGKPDQIWCTTTEPAIGPAEEAGEQPESKTSKDSIGLWTSTKSVRAKIIAASI
jgi:hypothetical protein